MRVMVLFAFSAMLGCAGVAYRPSPAYSPKEPTESEPAAPSTKSGFKYMVPPGWQATGAFKGFKDMLRHPEKKGAILIRIVKTNDASLLQDAEELRGILGKIAGAQVGEIKSNGLPGNRAWFTWSIQRINRRSLGKVVIRQFPAEGYLAPMTVACIGVWPEAADKELSKDLDLVIDSFK